MATGDIYLPQARKLDSDETGSIGSILQKALMNYEALTKARYLKRQEEATTKSMEEKAELPFGGAAMPGAAGQVLALEMMRRKFGENSEVYQQALRDHHLGKDSISSRINYQDRLASTIPLRYTTPQGRGLIEGSHLRQGYSPTGTPVGEPVAPGLPAYQNPGNQTPAQTANGYDLLRQKNNVSPDVLKRNLFATNVEKTLQMINPDDLTRYTGMKGAVNKKIQETLSPFGGESKEYGNYLEAKNNVGVLVKQIRQFYGDSIQPEVQKDLKKLLDPDVWSSNPKLAKQLFNNVVTLLGQELGTYREATQSTDVYHGANNQSNNSTPVKQQIRQDAEKFKSEPIIMVGPDGQQYEVPQGEAQGLIEQGFKRITGAPQLGANKGRDLAKAINNKPEIEATKKINGKTYEKINGDWHEK